MVTGLFSPLVLRSGAGCATGAGLLTTGNVMVHAEALTGPGGVELGKHSKRFGRPVAMTKEQISATVKRFATTGGLAERAGFDGVEVHAAHGYLLSQFLSPLVNKRSDEWGGGLENRAQLLLDVVRAIRMVVSSPFTVAVKLNSADFQRGQDPSAIRARVRPAHATARARPLPHVGGDPGMTTRPLTHAICWVAALQPREWCK